MRKREEIIKQYFATWLTKDVTPLHEIMSENIIYCECYGPEYHGLQQVIRWFVDWNQCGVVLQWEIKQFIHQDSVTVVEWYFECDYEGNIDGFDGVSLVTFDDSNKMCSIKEFQSKAEHYFPYGE